MDVPIDSLDTSATGRGKSAAATIDLTHEPRPSGSKPRTLGGDLPREAVPVRKIGQGQGGPSTEILWGNTLPVPPLLTFLSSELEGEDTVLEAKNSENDSGALFDLHLVPF